MCVCVQRMRLGLADDVPGPRWRARRDTAVVASAPHRAGPRPGRAGRSGESNDDLCSFPLRTLQLQARRGMPQAHNG